MKTIVLISCGAKKAPARVQAQKMYLGGLFKKSLVYAKTLTSDENIYILSAKYGLLKLTDEIAPYDVTLSYISPKKKGDTQVLTPTEKEAWGEGVVANLKKVADIEKDKFIVLAGESYVEPLKEAGLKNIELPLEGLGQGERTKKLEELINEANQDLLKKLVTDLHGISSKKKRYKFPLSENDENEFPKNGIYIFFEEGEKFGNLDRIVRVGTHKKDNWLPKRLSQHFSGNVNSSIFRKNIGRSIVRTSDIAKNPKLEQQISDHLQNKTSFIVFEVKTKEERLFWEAKIASTLAKSDDFRNAISNDWKGKKSPIEKIKTSGLWQVQGLNGAILTPAEFQELKKLMK